MTAVAPEVAPMVQQTQSETANQVFGAVGTRLTGGTVSTGGEGMSSGDSIFKRGAMWVQGLFNKSKLDDTSKAKGFDADSSGIAFGAEKFVNDDVKVGAGYAYTNTDIDGFMRSTDVDTHTAIVYGEGEALDRFGMEFGAGVTAEVNDNVELSLGYEGKFREDYQDHTGLINAKYKF